MGYYSRLWGRLDMTNKLAGNGGEVALTILSLQNLVARNAQISLNQVN